MIDLDNEHERNFDDHHSKDITLFFLDSRKQLTHFSAFLLGIKMKYFAMIAAIFMAALCAATTSTDDAMTPPTSPVCPPANFSSKKDFNPVKYFDGRWFSLIQMPVAYQPLDIFFCTNANYKLLPTPECEVAGCDDKYVDIINLSRRGSIYGNSSRVNLRGFIPDPSVPSKAIVGQPGLPSSFYGPYWVIEAGSYADLLEDPTQHFTGDNYEWVLISGAAPEVATENGCLPGVGPKNTNGLWILSRESVVSDEIFNKVVQAAKSKGFDVTAMKPVAQKGCSYD